MLAQIIAMSGRRNLILRQELRAGVGKLHRPALAASRAVVALLVCAALAMSSACTTMGTLTVEPPVSQASRYAAIVIDARNGRVLRAVNAYDVRYPASLTKMMSLYLLFEALRGGDLTLSSPIVFSANASSQPPTKLGVKPGDSISVDTAIRAMVVKSANDAAVAVAETLAGSERAFAARMTAQARALGMNDTVFANASGLPDDRQVTTARDMALLALALRSHFPERYHYFSLREFTFHGRTVRGHNHLLGKVAGVDGIKTGYTRASGFNLATSAHRNGRRIVAVILGEDRAKLRDAHMVELIDRYLPRASR